MLKKKSMTGLDIGTSSIKAVTLKESSNGLEVTHIGIASLPPEAIVSGIVQEPELVTQGIQEALTNGNIKEKNVYLGLSGDSIITREIEMPKMTHEELKESIKWEAEEYLPFEVDDAIIDFVILEELEENLNVLLVGAKKEVVENFLAPLDKAKIKPISLNIEPFALHSLIDYSMEIGDQNVAVIDIGYATTAILLMRGRTLQLIRSLDMGGRDFTQVIEESFQLNTQQAENLKIKVSNLQEGSQMASDDIPLDSVKEVLVDHSRSLLDEINRSFSYFQVQQRGMSLDHIFLTGNGSLLLGLTDILFKELAVSAEILDPFTNIAINKEFDPFVMRSVPSLAVAIGLVLSELEES